MRLALLVVIFVFLSYFLLRKGAKDYFFYAFAFLAVFLRFITEKLLPMEGNQMMSDFLRGGGVFFVAMSGVFLSVSKLINERFLHILLLSCGYVLAAGVLRSVANEYLSLYTTFISFCFFMLLLFVLRGNLNLKPSEVIRFSIGLGLFQAVMGIVQYYAPANLLPYLILERYSTHTGALNIGLADLDVGTVVQGTLNRFNTFGNFQSYILLLHVGYNMLFLRRRKILDVVIALLLGYSIFISGNRASILSLIAGFLLLLFYYRRPLFFLVGTLFLVFFTSANLFIDQMVASGAQSTSDPFQRLMSAFVVFKGSAGIQNSGSTLFYSLSLLPDFLDNIVFGGGRYFTTGYQLVGARSGISIFDTTLATLLTEFGIVGFLVLLLPYIYFFRWCRQHFKGKKEYPVFLSLMLLFLLQTFTDPGLFGLDATYLFGMLLMAFYVRNRRAQSEKRSKIIQAKQQIAVNAS